MEGLRIVEHTGNEYKRLVSNAKWTLACLNYAERFDERNIREFERHNLTEETFVLLNGEAKLWMFDDNGEVKMIPLKPMKFYNVGAGVWHNISVSLDARVMVAENADTSKDNTEYMNIASREIYSKGPKFEEVLPGTYLLKVPFGPVWTGIVLIKAQGANVLIDSSHLEPEKYLIPALANLGLKLSDITYLLNTHCHGDHIGGHHALVAKYGLKTACLDTSADALRDPVKVAIRVRTKFPENSPAPQSYLRGVEPDVILKEHELLLDRFYAVATPGHDDDCVCWIDTETGTAFTGDSLQANGTSTQGLGFYRSLPAYRESLRKMKGEPIENIVCGHEYDGIGSVILGKANVEKALAFCEKMVEVYGQEVAKYAAKQRVESEADIAALARRIIGEVGCGTPGQLFLAMHTVHQHLIVMRNVE